MTTLRVAGLGAGYFSRFHYDSWRRMPRARLVGVCDHVPDRAAATGAPAFTDLALMIEQVRPDLLDLIVPPAAQYDAIAQALHAGVRTLICQKPFGLDATQARAITNMIHAHGARLIIHENVRFQPWYRQLKTVLQSDQLGQVLQATFRLRPGDGQGPAAYLDRQPAFQTMPRFLVQETAVHWIDTFRYLFGPPHAVYADLRQINPVLAGEDAGHVLLDHPHGVRAVFDGNRCLDHATDNPRRTMGEMVVEGTSGTLTLTGDGALWLRAFGDSCATCVRSADGSGGFGGDCVHALQSHVVSGLLDGTPIENLASDYLLVRDIEAAVYRSAATGQKVVLETD